MKKKPRVLAFYLPQFHPTPENDEWWGKGFTEWTNVVRAEPQFPGHYQPHLPGELGFYDLRVPEVRSAQADLAREYGVFGFCYYHYWFHGRQILERPLKEVLESGQPDFPFCICWANESWTRSWHRGDRDVLIEQRYSQADDVAHIRWLLPYLCDRRYVTVQGKPLILIYRASSLPNVRETIECWQREARAAGLPGLYIARVESNFPGEDGPIAGTGLDASVEFQPRSIGARDIWWLSGRLRHFAPRGLRRNRVRDYNALVAEALSRPRPEYKRYPCVTPAWDNTSRRAPRLPAQIWIRSSPAAYREWLTETIRRFEPFGPDEDFVFVNAWNEWAEGNHLEPDQKWGRAYLEATLQALSGLAG